MRERGLREDARRRSRRTRGARTRVRSATPSSHLITRNGLGVDLLHDRRRGKLHGERLAPVARLRLAGRGFQPVRRAAARLAAIAHADAITHGIVAGAHGVVGALRGGARETFPEACDRAEHCEDDGCDACAARHGRDRPNSLALRSARASRNSSPRHARSATPPPARARRGATNAARSAISPAPSARTPTGTSSSPSKAPRPPGPTPGSGTSSRSR